MLGRDVLAAASRGVGTWPEDCERRGSGVGDLQFQQCTILGDVMPLVALRVSTTSLASRTILG